MKYIINPILTDKEIVDIVLKLDRFDEVGYLCDYEGHELEPKIIDSADNDDISFVPEWDMARTNEGRTFVYRIILDDKYREFTIGNSERNKRLDSYGIFNHEAIGKYNEYVRNIRNEMIKPYIDSGLIVEVEGE